MSIELTSAEMETHLNLCADDRKTWHVYSDDPVMQRRLEAIGATLVKQSPDGVSKWYTLPASQITIRKPAKPLSEARKTQLAERMRSMRQPQPAQ